MQTMENGCGTIYHNLFHIFFHMSLQIAAPWRGYLLNKRLIKSDVCFFYNFSIFVFLFLKVLLVFIFYRFEIYYLNRNAPCSFPCFAVRAGALAKNHKVEARCKGRSVAKCILPFTLRILVIA